MKINVLYNKLAGNLNPDKLTATLKELLPEDELAFYSVTELELDGEKIELKAFLKKLNAEEIILIAGGDGTLNRFVNDAEELLGKHSVWYYPAGNGNDFWNDICGKAEAKPVCIDKYLKDLPVVTVHGKDYKFLNGVGFGIDGYCCEVGDKLKAQDKKVNYTGIAIKGLLFHYKPCTAHVTVDGETFDFKKAWIAPTMHGKYYGGGMIPTPEQDRLGGKKSSVCLFYGKGRLATLIVFPSIFKGEHVKKTKMVKILTGKDITVKFERPTALQIDGETVLNVSEYTVKS